MTPAKRAAIYARVSTLDQEPENQLVELRRYVAARGWTAVEFVDRGVSGTKDRRPALDRLVRDAKQRRFDALVVWRLESPGSESQTPHSAPRRPSGHRGGVRLVERGHRRYHACWEAFNYTFWRLFRSLSGPESLSGLQRGSPGPDGKGRSWDGHAAISHGQTLNERRPCRAGVRPRYLESRRPRCGGFGLKRRDSPIARMFRQ